MMQLPFGRDRFWLFIAALPVLLLVFTLFAIPGYGLDDAYITMHNARVLTEYGGHDPVYGSPALIGATSSLHLATMAALGLVLPLLTASQLLTAAGVIAYASGLWQFARGLALAPWRCAVLTGVGLASGYLPFHLINGLETGWAMAAVIWTIVLADSRWLPLLCGLLPFLRPELALLAGPVMLRRLWLLRADRRACAEAVVLAIVVATPFALWMVVTTGHLVPNTAAAKLAFFGNVSQSVLYRGKQVIWAFLHCRLLLLCLGLVGLAWMRAGWAVAVFVVLWLLLSMMTVPAALTHNSFRYIAIIAPVAVAGLATMSSVFGRIMDVPLLAIGLWSAVTGVVGIEMALDQSLWVKMDAISRDVRTLTPPHAKILIHDAGYLAWTLPDRQLVDLVGLKTPASVEWNRRFIAGQGRRDLALDAIARTSGVQYMVAFTPGVPLWGNMSTLLQQDGWRVDLLNTPLPEGYGLYRLTAPATPPSGAGGL
jgi:hypothetical protein